MCIYIYIYIHTHCLYVYGFVYLTAVYFALSLYRRSPHTERMVEYG